MMTARTGVHRARRPWRPSPTVIARGLVSAGLCVALWLALFSGSLSAQAPISWSGTVDVSETTESATHPTVAADAYGRVHVIWAQKHGSDKARPSERLLTGDTLYYRMWNGESWTAPIDIIVGGDDAWYLTYPYATVDADGVIHLLWASQDSLLYSRASVLHAQSAAGWSRPTPIVEESGINQSRMVIGPNGDMHVVYTRAAPALRGDGNITYIRSQDQGATWSDPRALSAVGPFEERAMSDPRIALDSQDRLHVVWAANQAPSWTGQRILYARSEDGGDTWVPAIALGELEGDDNWADAPVVAATVDGTVHVVWACGRNPGRCYRASSDGGRTWSPKARILGELVSLAGWDALVADQEGTLHLAAQLRDPDAIYYTYKRLNGGWAPPVAVVTEPGADHGHYLQGALAAGNQFHVVMQNAIVATVYHVRVTTTAPAVAAVPTPTIAPPAPSRGDPARVVQGSQPPSQVAARSDDGPLLSPPTAVPADAGPALEATAPGRALTLALVPTVGLLLLIVGLRRRRA
jgi:hypothetical protein